VVLLLILVSTVDNILNLAGDRIFLYLHVLHRNDNYILFILKMH
jgi:hypothetical protein